MRKGVGRFRMHPHGTPNGAIPAPTRRTVAYIRVSTEEQATEGDSLLDQERACRLYAQARVAMQEAGWGEVDEIYADPGVSGRAEQGSGRAEIIAGRGAFVESFALFGCDLDDYHALFAEKLDLLLRLRASERLRATIGGMAK
jgi:DNA invertase Pin-like site-specific DNA recombinase